MCENFVCKYLDRKVWQILPERCLELENCEICPCFFDCRFCMKAYDCIKKSNIIKEKQPIKKVILPRGE